MAGRRKRKRSCKIIAAKAAAFVMVVGLVAAISSHASKNLICPFDGGLAKSYFLSNTGATAAIPQAIGSRPVYPYSIIPGGIRSGSELEQAIARDPLVAAHYGDFNVTEARIVTLEKPRLAYVSYRLDNRIFWTRRMLVLRAGETLLTDGEHFARTRCGNRLSKHPRAQVSKFEPPPAAFDKALPPAATGVTTAAAHAAPNSMVPQTVSALPVTPASFMQSPPTLAAPAPTVLIGFPAPPVNRIAAPVCDEKNPPPGGCPKTGCTSKHPCPPPPGENTPEPSTVILFATGLIAAIGVSRRKRNRVSV
jgi:hypothetical protein